MSQNDRTERLLNLLFALMASSRPVPKHVLRDVIDAYRTSPSNEAFERMFERDKDELRSMGVPVETVEGADGVGGIEGYRVAATAYALPAVDFTADELAVLGLAARVWEQAILGPAAQRAVRKLEALGPGVVVEGPVGVETRIATAEPSFPVLLDAVRNRRAVRFAYRKPGEEAPEQREVQPWGVASRRGHWYLVGHDVGRGAARVFRLSRVAGTASAYGAPGAYDVPDGIDVAAMIAASAPRPDALTARIRVAPGRANGLRRRAATTAPDGDGDVLEVPYSDDEAMAADVVGLGSAAVVLEPASLRSAVVRRLRVAAGEGAA
ncbi:MAG TPA: WYL domain-containing protein [Candidatus Angelobacter sp.]|nr:WYL domain-containing protein [Candidatus Angelobacter sp.]